jgi:hypothetical protein
MIKCLSLVRVNLTIKFFLILSKGRLAYSWNILLRANDDKGRAALEIFDGDIARDEFIKRYAPMLDGMDLAAYMRFVDADNYTTTDMAGAVL